MPSPQYRKEASHCRAAAAADPADAVRWRRLAEQFDLLAESVERSKTAGSQRTRRQPAQQQQTKSGKPEPSQLGQLRYYRPDCSQCGRQTLAGAHRACRRAGLRSADIRMRRVRECGSRQDEIPLSRGRNPRRATHVTGCVTGGDFADARLAATAGDPSARTRAR